MTKLEKQLNELNLTEKECLVMEMYIPELYAEVGFSDVGVEELSKWSGIPMTSIRGVIGSLIKKGIIQVHDGGEDIVYLMNEYHYLHPVWSKE